MKVIRCLRHLHVACLQSVVLLVMSWCSITRASEHGVKCEN
jgi:hypothetical protein